MNTRTNHGAIVPIELTPELAAKAFTLPTPPPGMKWHRDDGWTADKLLTPDDSPPWTEWHGGECPLKDEEVEEWERRYRNGSFFRNDKPSNFEWTHSGENADIIAYRVLKWRKQKPKKPFGPEDVPPGSVFRPIHWGEGPEWLLVTRVHSTECEIAGEASSWSRLRQYFQINRSIPLTGKWNPDAWEPCER